MRRIVLVLLLFGAGLAVLFLVRQRRERPVSHPPGPSELREGDASFTEVPLPAEKQGERGDTVGIYFRGPFLAREIAGEGPLRRSIQAGNVEPLGDNVYDFYELVIEVRDRASDELVARLDSPLSRLRVPLENGIPRFGEDEAIELADAQITLYRGAPTVPATLRRVPKLAWEIAPGRLSSDDRVELSGTGLQAEGTGLDIDLGRSSFRLRRAGEIRLSIDPRISAALKATGADASIEVVRESAESDEISVVASGGARLVVVEKLADGREKTDQIDARELSLRGRPAPPLATGAPGPQRGFELVAADAQGEVVATSAEQTFRAERASFAFQAQGRVDSARLVGAVVLQSRDDVFQAREAGFRFDASGRLARAELSGAPQGAVELGRYLPSTREVAGLPAHGLETARAQIAGDGPLVIDFGVRTTIDLAGRGTIAVPELELSLTAEKSLHGEVDPETRAGKLDAQGAVEATYAANKIATDGLAIQYTLDPRGMAVVDAEASGRTTITGVVDRPGRDELTLEARGGLSARIDGGRLFVPIAREVEVSLGGAQGFRASSGAVRDLDWRAQTFEAEGGVEFADASGHGSADRAVSRGPRERALYGVPGKPAHYELVRAPSALTGDREMTASAQALVIEAHGDAFDASGDVRAKVEAPDASCELACGKLHVDLAPRGVGGTGGPGGIEGPGPGGERPFRIRAEDGISARLVSSTAKSSIACERLEIDGALVGPVTSAGTAIDTATVRAQGDVRIDYLAKIAVRGEGDLLTLDRDRHGRLAARAGEQVRAVVQLAERGAPYAIQADWIEFSPDHVEAANVSIDVEADPAVEEQARAAQEPSPLLAMRARRFTAARDRVRLEGDAHLSGATRQGEPWTVDAGTIEVAGRWQQGQRFSVDALESVEATGGFRAELGLRARASGETLRGDATRFRFEGSPARLEYGGALWESEWIQHDMANMLLETDRGRLRSIEEEQPSSWSLTYESLKPFDQADTTILVLRNPVFLQDSTELRADWMLFWVDREEWRRSGELVIEESVAGPKLRQTSPDAPKSPKAPKFVSNDPRAQIASFRNHAMARLLGEVYIEGNVELLEAQQRKARASAIYLDLVDGHGWVQDADVLIDVEIRNRLRRLRAKAHWLRVAADGSLRAADAVVTSCEYDEPHYVVETGDLRLKWTPKKGIGFNVSARSNELRFESGFAIPLPPLVYEEDEQGNSFIENMIAGNSSRFGTSVRASFNVTLGGLGRGFGKLIGKVLDFPAAALQGHWTFDAGYLGSRGLLLGTGLEYDVKDEHGQDLFQLDSEISGIPDDNEDKGFVRVDPDDRSTLRTWFRARGRYLLDAEEWFDLALSLQSDPGVQSEFFERNFLGYEQKDNFVHWRKAHDENYLSASAKLVLEDRTDVDELPAIGFLHGRTPIGSIGDLPLLYAASADAAYLRRREGLFPFDPPSPPGYGPYPDMLGERETLRFDTEHRLETPFPVGFAAIRATPWLAARGTAWDEAVDPADSPTRAGLFVGFDLSTTLWRRYVNGGIHAISPTVGLRSDVVVEESGGEPVEFDAVEEPIEGRFVDLGLRSRWWRPETKERFDLEVRASHGAGLAAGEDDGWRPVAVLSEFLTFWGNVPVGFAHDGRYAIEGGDGAIYSLSSFGFEPHRKLGIELGYSRGIDEETGFGLFEAASFGTRYRATRKWEFEMEQTVSLLDNTNLDNRFTLRRIGHDFLTEIEVGYRAGEGADFSINLIPDLTWRRSSLGLIDRELGVDR